MATRLTDWLPPVAVVLGAAAGFALGALGVGDFAWMHGVADRGWSKACDIASETLLNTHDRLELERATILTRRLDCDVVRRVVPMLVHKEAVQWATTSASASMHRAEQAFRITATSGSIALR